MKNNDLFDIILEALESLPVDDVDRNCGIDALSKIKQKISNLEQGLDNCKTYVQELYCINKELTYEEVNTIKFIEEAIENALKEGNE